MLLLNVQVKRTVLQERKAASTFPLPALSFEPGCQDTAQSPSALEAQKASLSCSQALQRAGI